MIALLGALA
ncbi:hypothetical protein VCHC62B1_0234A, partial [Vibrio cholerae HC-62B1]